MRVSDKNLGYLVLLLLLGVGAAVALQMWNKQRNARDTVYVLYQQLGSLQPEDPVTIRGYRVGKVSAVRWLPGKGALVTLSLDNPRIFRTGTDFRNENFSLMGQRRIDVVPDRDGDITPSDHIFVGTFEPGIAEVLHLMETVITEVALVQNLALRLQNGDSTHPSLQTSIEALLDQGDEITERLDATVRTVTPTLGQALGSVDRISRQTVITGREATTTIRDLHGTITLTMEDARVLLANLQATLARLDQVLDGIESSPMTGNLLERKELLENIVQLVGSLQAVVHKVDGKGIVLLDENGKRKSMVKLKNINLFGKTAREKNRQKP